MKKKNFVSSISKQLTALLLCVALLAGPLATSAGAAQDGSSCNSTALSPFYHRCRR